MVWRLRQWAKPQKPVSFADFMRTRIFGQQVPESSVNSAKSVFLALFADF
jgi:hypothetical protein